MDFTFPAIAIAHSCFKEKFGIPRQPGLAPHSTAVLELLPPYNQADAVTGLELSSHIWVQFVFHANSRQEWKPKVKPPRLGGNKSLGVFATRSPVRPSPIGLSVVKLERIECDNQKVLLHVSGVDLLDGTPILDIKPYVPYVDRVNDAHNHFAEMPPPFIEVFFSPLLNKVLADQQYQGTNLRELIQEVLQQDPRPQYQTPDPSRAYGMKLSDFDVQWHYEMSDNVTKIIVDNIITLT